MTEQAPNIIIYNTIDGKASVALYAKDGKIWLNQQQIAELFATSKPNISMHISNILKEKELNRDSVVKDFLTTVADGKNYNVVFYSLEMILAVGSRKGDPDVLCRNAKQAAFRRNPQHSSRDYRSKGQSRVAKYGTNDLEGECRAQR